MIICLSTTLKEHLCTHGDTLEEAFDEFTELIDNSITYDDVQFVDLGVNPSFDRYELVTRLKTKNE